MAYKLFRTLSAKEITEIYDEIKELSAASLFTTHTTDTEYQKSGPLRDGTTCWIQHHDHNNLQHIDLIPATMCIVEEVLQIEKLSKIGRFYFHRLLPGDSIGAHADINQYHLSVNRYQIYLDVPVKLDIVHKGPQILTGEIIQFDHHSTHKYTNNSDQPVSFIVFDLYKGI